MTFQIDVSYEDLTSLDREVMLNGCGPDSGVISRWFDVPDLAFGEACDRHDFDYRVGGPADSGEDSSYRHTADLRFYDHMKSVADHSPWYYRWSRRWLAWTYYRAVSNFGLPHFYIRDPDDRVTLDSMRKDSGSHPNRESSAFTSCMVDAGCWSHP